MNLLHMCRGSRLQGLSAAVILLHALYTLVWHLKESCRSPVSCFRERLQQEDNMEAVRKRPAPRTNKQLSRVFPAVG